MTGHPQVLKYSDKTNLDINSEDVTRTSSLSNHFILLSAIIIIFVFDFQSKHFISFYALQILVQAKVQESLRLVFQYMVRCPCSYLHSINAILV